MNRVIGVLVFYFSCSTEGVKIIWDKSADFDIIGLDARSEEVNLPNQLLIYPGTKWCGAGNIADNESDFGIHRNTDKCCRNHDLCPDIIEGFQTDHNLINPSFYTRLHCDCDKEFYKCLKSVNTKTSREVGHIYFTILGTQCFKKEYPVVSCNKYSYFLKPKCIDYQFDETQEKIYQWFDVPNF
nr:phospholipase A2-like [Leptinotarsa decemlineata]